MLKNMKTNKFYNNNHNILGEKQKLGIAHIYLHSSKRKIIRETINK
jgi:hypothetical protein